MANRRNSTVTIPASHAPEDVEPTEPTEPTATEPTEPTATEPTEPTATEPTATETEPTEPTATEGGQIDPNTVASVGVDVSRCDGKNEAGNRQCILAPNHEGDHKFRQAGVKKERKPVELSVLSFEDVPDEESIEGVRESVRDTAQLEIDKRVKESHEAWVAAGKPEEFNTSPRKRIMFPPDQAESVAFMLDRAGRFLKLRVRTVGPKVHTSGNSMIYYVAMDKIARKPKPDASANGEAAPTGEATEPTEPTTTEPVTADVES